MRKDTPVRGVPVEVSDEVTGVLQGQALRDARNKRRTEERLDRVEEKQDKHGERLIKVESNVDWLVERKKEEIEEKRLERKLRAQTETNQAGIERVRINSRAKVIVAFVAGFFGAIGALAHYLAGKL